MVYDPGYHRSETAHLRDGEILGKQEVCELLGRTEMAWHKWRQFDRLPAADGPKVHGLPTWLRPTILAWAYRNHDFTLDKKGLALPCHEEAAACADWVPEVDTIDWCKRKQETA